MDTTWVRDSSVIWQMTATYMHNSINSTVS